MKHPQYAIEKGYLAVKQTPAGLEFTPYNPAAFSSAVQGESPIERNIRVDGAIYMERDIHSGGKYRFADGSATAPAISFAGATGTGFNRVATTTTIAASIAGTEKMRLDSSRLTLTDDIRFKSGTSFAGDFEHNNTADRVYTFPNASGTVWTSGNDGSGSGLDADTVDGAHASATPTASTIPIADGSNKIAAGWISEVLAVTDLSDVAAKSGTGTTILFQGSPSITSPTITGGSILDVVDFSLREDSGDFDLRIVPLAASLAADRTLTIDVNDAARTIDLGGNLTIANNFITSGNFSLTLTTTASTSVTLPTSGTLAVTTQKLDDWGAPDDNTDLNATSSAHGLLPKLSNVVTEFLNGQGGWTTPAGGSTTQTVEDHTTNDSLGSGESGSVHTNAGASGVVTLTLPAASAGLWFDFVVMAAQTLNIAEAGGDNIRIAGSTGVNAAANTIGHTLHVVAVSSSLWVATWGTGSWTLT